VLAQLAGALVEIHGHGIVHRDLKPDSVLVREDSTMAIAIWRRRTYRAVIADAKIIMCSARPIIWPGIILGEPASALTDIYSLGVLFYEMLTGRKPFTASNLRDLARQHLSAEVPPLDASLADYLPLLHGMLAKNPHERFQSAQDLLVGVDEVWTMLAVRVAQMR
jgi:serine/threonine protein kinase